MGIHWICSVNGEWGYGEMDDVVVRVDPSTWMVDSLQRLNRSVV